jgi:signal transduction histidine kinase
MAACREHAPTVGDQTVSRYRLKVRFACSRIHTSGRHPQRGHGRNLDSVDTLERSARRIGTRTDVALGAATTAVIVLGTVKIAKADPGWLLDLGVGLAICVTALPRRWNRAQAAVTGLVLFAAAGLATSLCSLPPGPLYGGALIGLLVLGIAAVRRLPPRPVAIIGVAGTVVIAATETASAGGLFGHHTLYVLTGATAWAAASAGLWLRYLDFRRRETLEAIRREERLELARELHDDVAHHVTGIVVQAQAVRFAGEQDPELLISALGSIESAGVNTLTAVRQLVGLLRDLDDTRGVSPAPEPINQLVERFTRHGPPVDLRIPADLTASGWPPPVASTVYRIVQEALTNVARHAPDARSVTVTITHDPQQVRIEITDDAPSVASRRFRPGGGYGLAGMRERVEALGGKVSAGPLPGAGWAVQARLPIPAQGLP